MNRNPIFLKQNYHEVNKLINQSFLSEKGPGDLPISSRKNKIAGIIAPNFDYINAGRSFAWSYKEIAEAEIPETYIILGTAQEGINTYLFGDWNSPLGSVLLNKQLGKTVIRSFPKVRNNYDTFANDRSIEVQLPFLQFASGNQERIQFTPFLIGTSTFEDITLLADAITDASENISVICSANLTYYGKGFNSVPFIYSVKENISSFDQKAIQLICKLDSKAFYEFTRDSGIFDRYNITLFIELMKGLGCKQGDVLDYFTFQEVGKQKNIVGLSSLFFRR